MLPESALHYQSIAFNRGGAPATAPMSSSTLGDTQPPRPLKPRSGAKTSRRATKGGPGSTSTGSSLRKEEGTIVYFDWDLPAN